MGIFNVKIVYEFLNSFPESLCVKYSAVMNMNYE